MLQKVGGVDILALESNLICSSLISYMNKKVDIVGLTPNSIFLIGPKMTTAQRKKIYVDLFVCFSFFCDLISGPFFLFSPSLSLPFSPFYHALLAPSHLGCANLV